MNIIKKTLSTAKQFLKGISNILKLSAWLLGIQIITSLFSIVMLADGENASSLLTFLSFIMLASAIAIMFFISKSTAYYDFEILKNNLIRAKRQEIVPKYRRMLEYRLYKGFIAGFIACLPSIILAVIGIIKNPIVSESNIFGTIAMLINFVYTIPILKIGGANSLYFIFVGCVLLIASSGISYMIHGEKLKYQYEMLSKRQAK